MGFGPSIPRYNINRGNSRSTIHLLNSNPLLGEWRVGFYNNYTNANPKFILILGDNNNTQATLQTINTSNGNVESSLVFGSNAIAPDTFFNIDICGDILTISELVPAISASASASGSGSIILQTTNSSFIDIVQLDGSNNGFSNVVGDLMQITSVPGCISSSLAPNNSGFSETDVQITVGCLAGAAFIFLILFLIFAALWDQARRAPAYY